MEGLLVGADGLQPWEKYLRVSQSLSFGSRQCYKMALGVLGSVGHGPIRAPR